MPIKTKTPVLTSKQILIQAHDILAASYWVSGVEANTDVAKLDWDDFTQLKKEKAFTKADPKTLRERLHDLIFEPGDKGIVLPGSRDDDRFTVVTAVCSIGAMALADALVRNTDLVDWCYLAQNNFEHTRASMALAQQLDLLALMRRNEDPHMGYGNAIADWNDASGRTRKQVLTAFQRAIDSPWVTRSSWWRWENKSGSSFLPVAFTTKAEGNAWLKDAREGKTKLSQMLYGYSDEHWQLRKVSKTSFIG